MSRLSRRAFVITACLLATTANSEVLDAKPVLRSAAFPQGRARAAFAYDVKCGLFLVYGEYILNGNQPESASDIWAWNGSTWRLLSGETNDARTQASIVYDSKLDRVFLFGGFGRQNEAGGQLAVLDGQKWTIVGDEKTMARGDTAMVYDAGRNRVVLFGGQGEKGYLADTWEFDGKRWLDVSPKS